MNDAISDVMSSLQVGGQVVLTETYQPPWAIRIPEGAAFLARMSLPQTTTIVPFHMVRRGSFELEAATGEHEIVRTGEAVICIGSQSHIMSCGNPVETVPFEDILDKKTPTVGSGGPEGATELVCGVFALKNTDRNPLLQSLPRIIKIGIDGEAPSQPLRSLADLLAIEAQQPKPGSTYMSQRLVELFCVEILRTHIFCHAKSSGAWVQAMADPKIGSALNVLHGDLAAPHSVESLAHSVGMSGSRFAARFRDLMGISPLKYLRQWRMSKAIERLETGDASNAEIADSVGYESVAAFARAFKSETGRTPGSFRRKQRQLSPGRPHG